MMWWAMWCAAVVVGSSVVVAAPASDSLNMDMVQMEPSAPDDESMYAVQPMGGRYAAAPWLYLLSDMPHDSQVTIEANEVRPSQKDTSMQEESNHEEKLSRERRSFTVNDPVEHLQRNVYLNYIGRVAQENREFLNRIGKRGYQQWSAVPDKYY